MLGMRCNGATVVLRMLNGQCTESLGEARIRLDVFGRSVDLVCLVSLTRVYDCSVIRGMDGILKLGGFCVNGDGTVSFPNAWDGLAVATGERSVAENDHDFAACFDGEKWTIRWKWKDGEPVLTNRCSQYKVAEDCQQAYDGEVEQWIRDEWLEPHDKTLHGKVDGVIPLIAVVQPNKQRKVKPVMDYGREMNDYINSNPGKEAVVCQDQDWRRRGEDCFMLNLKKAYLQLHVDRDL